MVDIPARRSLCSGRARRAVAALAAAGCLAFLSFAPGAAFAAEPGDPSGWEAAPYSPLPWSNIGAIGNAVTLDFAGDDGGLTDAAGAATGFTLVQPDAAGAPAFVPDQLAVANGVLSITVPPETAAEQNLVGLGVDAEQRTLQVSVAVSGTGGRAGLWFGPRGGDRVELTVDAPAPDAPITAVLLERRGATVATSATIPVAAGGPVVLQLVVDASPAPRSPASASMALL